ncbi:uncharacterized protein LAJ45_06626 [Morchella importuna]|uniref:uncharacterized protein n=1 Tax=Morchella importuna TaxID=1174673 RepID=UPI001E8DF81C|nr:uncharacterized protein LAJ45_06626 [Morchella importuna]KAH8149087.1 hypothetical protein LAJ45_06626 [Morchella importuna]
MQHISTSTPTLIVNHKVSLGTTTQSTTRHRSLGSATLPVSSRKRNAPYRRPQVHCAFLNRNVPLVAQLHSRTHPSQVARPRRPQARLLGYIRKRHTPGRFRDTQAQRPGDFGVVAVNMVP